MVPYAEPALARADTRAARVRGTVQIPSNFSVSFLKRILSEWRFSQFTFHYLIQDEEKIGKNETILIALDVSDPQLTLFIKKAIQTSTDDFIAHVSQVCKEDLDDGIDMNMVTLATPLLGDDDTDFR